MFYLTTHSTHIIYGYMASDIWLRTILIVTKETRCHHIGYSFRLTARVLLYAPSHRQDSTYHSLCYTRLEWEIAQVVHHEGSILTIHHFMSKRSYHGAKSRSGNKWVWCKMKYLREPTDELGISVSNYWCEQTGRKQKLKLIHKLLSIWCERSKNYIKNHIYLGMMSLT